MDSVTKRVPVNIPCPGCDRALVQLERCRDACPTCGLIVVNERRAELYIRRTFRAREVLVAG